MLPGLDVDETMDRVVQIAQCILFDCQVYWHLRVCVAVGKLLKMKLAVNSNVAVVVDAMPLMLPNSCAASHQAKDYVHLHHQEQ